VYDLPQRALPPEALTGPVPGDGECVTALADIAGRALGIATVGDLADFHRLTRAEIAAVLRDTALVKVRVAGWREAAWGRM
jgi:uncharacterized protein YcaQ